MGLVPGELWQMDVTHIPSFGKLKFVHVSINTFSGFLCASAHTGYSSLKFKQFCAQLQIKHITGIPYNPSGAGNCRKGPSDLKEYPD